ncbi:M48 family metallopeptidase [Reinekea sp.]|jgi:Zn-dependent protease with chaperone function|uniref:M48 family metallopeptidase n=1 Tax=Reinekea sp. TaxID=1970455 RepID=UPI002A83591E|nr:M48 family metallopeptidase [Reinekea sp.]
MDFFEQQDRARKKTGQLILLFAIGLLATLVTINLLCFVCYWMLYSPVETSYSEPLPVVQSVLVQLFQLETAAPAGPRSGLGSAWLSWWHSNLNWQISLGVIAAVVIGTVFRFLELAGGGRKVAEWAGAKPIRMSSTNPAVKQLINVCEEMAIAAGMPVPELYLMEREPGINAFVAGYSTQEAVLVVTQGALDLLTRDQLQGVIGHEYSHILNGDMRLNIRLMAFLAGLVLIGQIGRFFLLEASLWRGATRNRSRENSLSVPLLTALGLILAVVGYIGVLIGRMIKAAVSRQREFLADASAVQFTRLPDGLAGALYAIKVNAAGSQLAHRHAEDMSHFCFGESVALSDRLATHPPVVERIRRIAPNFVAVERSRRRRTESAQDSVARSKPQAFDTALTMVGITALVGQVTPEHLNYARNLYRHIPEQIKNWVHQSAGARAYLYCQVLLGTSSGRQNLLNRIKQEDRGVIEVLQKIWPYCQQMDEQLRLPILELLIPTLKKLPEAERTIFLDRLERFIYLDGRVDFIEWVTLTLVHLRIRPRDGAAQQKLDGKIENYFSALSTIFNVLVELSRDKTAAEQAHQNICRQLGMAHEPNQTLQSIGYQRLGVALMSLESINFFWRKTLLQAFADLIQADGQVEFREYEILRIMAECLECPLPPLLQAQPVLA